MSNNENDYEEKQYEYKRKIYEDNMRLWEFFDKTAGEMDSNFDKRLFTIAAGSFGVSFAFIDRFINMAKAVSPKFLVISWGFFIFCIVSIVVGHLISAESYRRIRDNVAKDMYLMFEGKPAEKRHHKDFVSPLNYVSLISFIGGIVCLLLFVLINI